MIITTYNFKEIEKQVLTKLLAEYPDFTRLEISKMTGESERNIYRKMIKYGLFAPRHSGKTNKQGLYRAHKPKDKK